MPFCLIADESVEENIKRIVSEEINHSIKEIDIPKLKRAEAVHEIRKHCKKIRAVLRLVRPQFERTYQFENKWFRDTAKGISELRDAEAIIETYDSLLDKFSDQIDRRAFAPTRRALSERRKETFQEAGDLGDKLKKLRARMDKAVGRIEHWKLKLIEFDGVEPGLMAAYRQARKTMAAAYDDPIAENFHEWRIKAKYHNYHMRLMHELWEPVVDSLAKETDELSDLLGDDHNLDVLHKTLVKSPKKYGKKRDIQVLVGLIDRRSAELRAEANTIGSRIFAEKPTAFSQRFRGYWEAWRSDEERPSKKLSEEPAVVTAGA